METDMIVDVQIKKPVLPTSSSTEMLTFFFENGAIASLRGSGTEPKLKYYIQISGTDPETLKRELEELVMEFITNFLQPEKFGLIPPKQE